MLNVFLVAVPELVPDPVIDTTSFAGYLPQAPPAGNIVPVSCCSFSLSPCTSWSYSCLLWN